MKSIVITPNWEATTEWFARNLREWGFEKNAHEPVISLIEQVRYLQQTDPEALDRVIERLK